MSDYFYENFMEERKKQKHAFLKWYAAVELIPAVAVIFILLNYADIISFLESINVFLAYTLVIVGMASVIVIKMFFDKIIYEKVNRLALYNAAAKEDTTFLTKWLLDYDSFYLSFYGKIPSYSETVKALEVYAGNKISQ